MIFRKGYVTASIDVLINDLEDPVKALNVQGYTEACALGSQDTESEVVIPVLIVVASNAIGSSVITYSQLAAAEVAENIIETLNEGYSEANLKFTSTVKVSDSLTDVGGVMNITTDEFVGALPDKYGTIESYSVATHGFRSSIENEERDATKGAHREGFLVKLNSLVDTEAILTIVLVSALNNTPMGGAEILPLSEGPHPGVGRPLVGYIPFYSLTVEDQTTLGVDYSEALITPPRFTGAGESRKQIYINLVGSMLGLFPTYTPNISKLSKTDELATCASMGCISAGGSGDCMNDIFPYVGESTLFEELLLDTAGNHASSCGDSFHWRFRDKYISGDNVMTFRVDATDSVWSAKQVEFIRGSMVTTGSPWNGFAVSALEYTTEEVEVEVDPCAEVIPASKLARYVDRMRNMTSSASSILEVTKKIQLLCNNILSK